MCIQPELMDDIISLGPYRVYSPEQSPINYVYRKRNLLRVVESQSLG
jgi:hypothetical protein